MSNSPVVVRGIAVIRHGETDWNLSRKLQGRTEVPLNETGRLQAREAAEQLLSAGSWTRIVASPLGRAAETAEIIAEVLGLRSLEIDHEVTERDFGVAEGLHYDDAVRRWPGLDVPDAETRDELAARGARALARLMQEAPGSIVVSHGALIRSALARLTGGEIPRILNCEAWEIVPHPAHPSHSLHSLHPADSADPADLKRVVADPVTPEASGLPPVLINRLGAPGRQHAV